MLLDGCLFFSFPAGWHWTASAVCCTRGPCKHQTIFPHCKRILRISQASACALALCADAQQDGLLWLMPLLAFVYVEVPNAQSSGHEAVASAAAERFQLDSCFLGK